jgi:DNA-binding Lrp family transcriptional regulator
MELTKPDLQLIDEIKNGLQISPRPYARIGSAIGVSEKEVIEALQRMIDGGAIRRFGVIVRHHELGYRANAMAVWDVPDEDARESARRMADFPFVTLCYRRPRRPPVWPYNLFCMVHGRERAIVLRQIRELVVACGLESARHEVLFSRRRFKQRGARYGSAGGDAA